MQVRDSTNKDMDKILDCMSGGDTSFFPLKCLVEEMDKRAAAGDYAADRLIDVVRHFARLIRLAEKIHKGEISNEPNVTY